MARKPAKQAQKANTQPAATASSTTPQSSIPEPFVAIPTTLRPLVAKLPTSHVYAIHVDNNPRDLKKRVYVVPILINLAITAVLAYRVYYAAPVYLDQIITIFGYETAWKVEPSEMSTGGLISTISSRTFLLMFDYALFGMLGSWPWEFVFGSKYLRHTGPLEWKTKLGFRDTEIVVRIGRKWDEKLFLTDAEGKDKTWTLEDELAIKFKIEPAMRKSHTSKTGFLLLDKDWDLDFRAMIDATQLVEKGAISIEDLDHIVLVHYQKRWLLWKVHAAQAEAQAKLSAATAKEDTNLQRFKEKLMANGCEDVFYRWIEIVQYESSLPGGFTRSRQDEATRELRSMLTDRSVDFDKFWKDVDGEKGVPGLGTTG